jgi:hypothetical protein
MGCMPQDGYWGDRIKLLYAEGTANARELLVTANAATGATFGYREGEYGNLPFYGFDMVPIKGETRLYDPDKRNASGNTPLYGPKSDEPQRVRMMLVNVTPSQYRRLDQMIYLSKLPSGSNIVLLNQRKAMFQQTGRKSRGAVGTFTAPVGEPVPTDLVYYWPVLKMDFSIIPEESFCDRFTGLYSVSLDGTEIDLSAGSDRAVF